MLFSGVNHTVIGATVQPGLKSPTRVVADAVSQSSVNRKFQFS